jgi:hypothetical protein
MGLQQKEITGGLYCNSHVITGEQLWLSVHPLPASAISALD